MLDLGANVSTQNTSQNSSNQNNSLTINVGDGKQDANVENSTATTQQAKQEFERKDEAALSVGVGVGADGYGGDIARKGDEVEKDDFFDILTNDTNKPILIISGVIVFVAGVFYFVTKKKKKK